MKILLKNITDKRNEENASTAPDERSISPAIISIVSPNARIATTEF
jgi:hypothetical protein